MTKLKLVKIISGFLGVSLFMFGVLKFVDPFKSWYTLQITASELPFPSYWLGILGEVTVGLSLIFALVFIEKIGQKNFNRLIYVCGIIIVLMMLTAFYVHYHPSVPADVLPLKIKPPYIPGSFMVLAGINMYLITHLSKQKVSS